MSKLGLRLNLQLAKGQGRYVGLNISMRFPRRPRVPWACRPCPGREGSRRPLVRWQDLL